MKVSTLALALCAGLATSAHAEPRDDLIAAFGKAAELTRYRLDIEVENKRGPIRSRMDVQLPNRFHMKTDEAEFISIPEGTWISAAGRWMRVPMDMSKQLQGYRLEDARKQAEGELGEVVKLGSAEVGGCQSERYRYTTSTRYGGREREDDVEVAICTRTGLPIELRSVPRRKGETVVIRYDFEAEVNIRPPG